MFNVNFKKLLLSLVTLSIVLVGVYIYSETLSTSWDDHLSPKTPHDDVIHITTYYQIDSNTILSDHKNGRVDTFITGKTKPEIPALPSNSFLWKGEDYLAIAEAVHEQEWKESLLEWHLYSL